MYQLEKRNNPARIEQIEKDPYNPYNNLNITKHEKMKWKHDFKQNAELITWINPSSD